MKVTLLTYNKDKYYEKVITAVNPILPNGEATCGEHSSTEKRSAPFSSLSLNSQSKTLYLLQITTTRNPCLRPCPPLHVMLGHRLTVITEFYVDIKLQLLIFRSQPILDFVIFLYSLRLAKKMIILNGPWRD